MVGYLTVNYGFGDTTAWLCSAVCHCGVCSGNWVLQLRGSGNGCVKVFQKSWTGCFLLAVSGPAPYLKCLEGSRNISPGNFSCWKKQGGGLKGKGSSREVRWAPQGPVLPSPSWLQDGSPAEDEITSTSFYDPFQQRFSPPFEYAARSLLLKCVLLL